MRSRVIKIIQLAEKYYSPKKFAHAMRVAGYASAMGDEHGYETDDDRLFVIGVCHDLIEDTGCPIEKLEKLLQEDELSAVNILTKDDDMEYYDYVKEIVDSHDELAIIVKRADMKDHLLLTDTLTDRLKEKYFPVLGMLM